LGPDFNAEVDLIVSDVMEKQAMGRIFVQMGRKAVLNGGRSMEFNLNNYGNMGKKIESKVKDKPRALTGG